MAFEGEILEIFSWLPASSILKFTSACKALNAFASDPFFIKKQHRNMLLNEESGFFIQPNSCQRYSDKLECYALSGPSLGLPREFVEFLKDTVRCMASSNGLVCCRNTSDTEIDGNHLFICNPATQSVQSIPAPTSLREASKDFQILFECNFGPSNETPYDDYLLMVIEGIEDWSSELLCKIYSPRERVWEDRGRIEIGARNILYDQFPLNHNGCAYFLSDWYNYIIKGSPFYKPYIVEYDLKKGTSRFLKLPKNIGRRNLLHRSCKFAISDMGRGLGKSVCLIMLVKGVFAVWTLADHSSGSWTQIFKMRARAMGIIEANAKIAGFTVINGDSLLVATENRVYQYRLAGDRRNNRRAEELCRHECGDNVLIQSYSSTLRPCGTTPCAFFYNFCHSYL